MLLFLEEHRLQILQGLKTETRRPTWTPGTKTKPSREKTARPAVPGAIHDFFTRPPFCRPPGTPFCSALILECGREPLGAIGVAGAFSEGYPSVHSYIGVWEKIWGAGSWRRDFRREVFVIRFQVTAQFVCAKCWDPEEPEYLRPWNRFRPEKYCRLCHGPDCDNG